MKSEAAIDHPVPRPRWAGFLVIGLALVVLAATLIWSALDLRGRIRAEIVQHDGETLDAVTVMQHANDLASGETIASLADAGEQFQLAFKVSRLRNVVGVRLYSADGEFANAFPAYISERALPASDLAQLRNLRPVSYFSDNGRMQEQDLLAETNSAATPLLFVEVPLKADERPQLAGIMQFIMDGSGIARQYARLDRNLALKFSSAFAVAAGILIGGLGLAMRHVQRANQQLAERTGNLLQANRELALAARTSAVGAVASHLIHGLKNPLSGLGSFVRAQTAEKSNGFDTDWQTALNTTQRMEDLINRVVRVLQEQQTGVEYEISLGELVEMLTQKARPLAESAGVCFAATVSCDTMLSNREADLILLILENLVQNGIEATPSGKSVEVRATGEAAMISFAVSDEGAGLSPTAAARLFTPGPSSKKGGGGIGLAISKQLAQSLGATLDLTQSSPSGCAFRLAVPRLPAGAFPQASGQTLPMDRPRADAS
ncbi:MAG: sensor histidine kinase [Limisphaerales bacterium]